ncbi:hypothetical protein B0H13DRAFT_2423708 [Mycena leptocephala]|nr:hypothetical protein B0H13DRAFT_2423708 [Mycena leptocephala]
MNEGRGRVDEDKVGREENKRRGNDGRGSGERTTWLKEEGKCSAQQMTLWLERKEKILRHDQFIVWKLAGSPGQPVINNLHRSSIYERKLTIPKHPPHKVVKFSALETAYETSFFRDALSRGRGKVTL